MKVLDFSVMREGVGRNTISLRLHCPDHEVPEVLEVIHNSHGQGKDVVIRKMTLLDRPMLGMTGRCQGKSEALKRVLGHQPTHKEEEDMQYKLHLGNELMLDIDKIQAELNARQPLAVIRRWDRVAFVIAPEVRRKAKLLGAALPEDGRFGRVSNKTIMALRSQLREIVGKQWADPKAKRATTVEVLPL